MMRVAVADVGTNSTHLLIAEARPGGFRVLDTLKDRTRLGECLDEEDNITEEGYSCLAHSLRQFRELAASQGVQELRAYATSAMRGAPNGEAVAERLRAEVGVYPVIISGEREGQLTYLGAAGSVHFGLDNLLLDLGGGSLELARGGMGEAARVVSLPLGSVRMHAQFLSGGPASKPPRKPDLNALKAHALRLLSAEIGPFRLESGTRVFGSSGTFETLAAVILARTSPARPSAVNTVQGSEGAGVNGLSFSVAALGDLLQDLCRMTTAKRAKMPGLDAKRADIIVAGALVLHTALELLGAETVTVSAGALREGTLHEYLLEQRDWTSGLPSRQRSVLELAERFGANLAHARQVTLLSQNLYDRLQALGVLPGSHVSGGPAEDDLAANPRSLLSAAATLHEIGLLVGQSSHHKHSAYLIRHAGLLGYDPAQIDMVAQVARYHRKSVPKPSHPEYAALTPADQKTLAQLAAVLRVADGLDRSHSQSVRILDLHRQSKAEQGRGQPGLTLRVSGVHGLELGGVTQKGDLWEQMFGPLKIEVAEA
ncbi:Ppx/GppA phosphatase family protein [Deinococcus radiomollis]|uniref:Ppx/GppA phosphatase family protein n=1 Tax=Deinococcus radiomollis TaxID=468916 RepID=UPI0038920B66